MPGPPPFPADLRSRVAWLAREFGEREVPLRAAALAYFAFFSLFPILLLTAAVLGYLVRLQTPLAQELERAVLEIATQTFAGSGSGDIVQGVFDSIALNAPAVGVAGLLGLVWGVSGSLSAVASAVTQIFDPDAPAPGFAARLRIGRVALAVGGVFLLFVLASQAFAVVVRFAPGLAGVEAVLRPLVNSLLPAATFAVLYRLLPFPRPKWRAALWGGLAGGLLFGAVQLGFTAYLRYVSFDTAFGPTAGLAVLLLWMQFSALAFLLGALLAAALQPGGREESAPSVERRAPNVEG